MKAFHQSPILPSSPLLLEEAMPPPTRRRKEGRTQQSVHPPLTVSAPLGGYRSQGMTQAIRCWAKLLEQATLELSLTPAQWNFLAQASAGREWDFQPEMGNPGEALAQVVERSIHYEVGLALLGKGAKEKAQDLARVLRELDYLHAWAVIWALQWHLEVGSKVKEGEEWWTLGHRQAHVGG